VVYGRTSMGVPVGKLQMQ